MRLIALITTAVMAGAGVGFSSGVGLAHAAAGVDGHSTRSATRADLQAITAEFVKLADALPTQPLFFHDLDEHGNNPRWVGLDVAGTLFAIPADAYVILSTLTGIEALADGGEAMAADGPAQQCAGLAILVCGEGMICCFCYAANGNAACSFSCRDEDGGCEPCPECGPDVTNYAAQ